MQIASWSAFMRFMENMGGQRLEKLTPEKIIQILAATKHEYSWCPDWFNLESREFTPVFEYGDFQPGGRRYEDIAELHKKHDSEGLSASPYAFTQDRFAVWRTRDENYTFPVALASSADPLPHTAPGELSKQEYSGLVKGRIMLIRSCCMKDLDRYKHHGVYFMRREVRVRIPYRIQWINRFGVNMLPEEAYTIRAWMYVGVRDHWYSQPEYTLVRCQAFQPNRRERNNIQFKIPPPNWRSEEPYYYFKPQGDHK